MWARQASRKATDTVQAMAGSGTGADACWAECHFPWLGTWQLATAGSFAGRRRAAGGGGSDCASERAAAAAAAAGLAEDTGCSWGRPWWAARPLGGVALAEGVYRRVIRRRQRGQGLMVDSACDGTCSVGSGRRLRC